MSAVNTLLQEALFCLSCIDRDKCKKNLKKCQGTFSNEILSLGKLSFPRAPDVIKKEASVLFRHGKHRKNATIT